MPAPNVELVLVLDASYSMRPCFDGVRRHLRALLRPMQGHVGTVRFGLVAVGAFPVGPDVVYPMSGLPGFSLDQVYSPQPAGLFTDDAARVEDALEGIELQGNEHNLLALDIALDFPFGPSTSTRRVIALLSDEPLEHGVEGEAGCAKIPALVEKLNQRRVKLFMALPTSAAAEALEAANGCEFEAISGGDGLASVDFSALFGQMGKSISISTLQGPGESPWQRALFGQDTWRRDSLGWRQTSGPAQ